MPVIIFHGDMDGRIPYPCGRQALSQWLDTNDLILKREHRTALPSAPTRVSHAMVPDGHAYTVASYSDKSHCLVARF